MGTGKTVAVLGAGVKVRVHDPKGLPNFQRMSGDVREAVFASYGTGRERWERRA